MRTKVKGHPDLVRDANGVLINLDQDGFKAYVAAREVAQAREDKISTLQNQLDEMTALVNKLIQAQPKTVQAKLNVETDDAADA